MSEEKLNHFLYGLLGKRKRRCLILTRWHSKPTMDLSTIVKFFDLVLHRPIQIAMHMDHFSLWADDTPFTIPYTWLLPHELQTITLLYRERSQYFAFCKVTPTTIFLTSCRVSPTLTLAHRRELIRDYCWLGMSNPKALETFRFILLHVVQTLMTCSGTDPFVYQLHYALQGHKSMEHLICVY